MRFAAALSGLVRDVAQQNDPDILIERIVDEALKLSGSASTVLLLLNEETGHLEPVASAGEPSANALAEVDDMGDSSAPNVLQFSIRDRNEKLRGVLQLECRNFNGFDREGIEAVKILADLICLVLDRRDRDLREEALIQIGSSLDHVLNEELLVRKVVEVAESMLRLQACSIFLLDPKSDTFVLRGTTGALKDSVGAISYVRGEGFTGWVCDTGKPILLNDPQSDPRWRGKYVEIPSDEIASFLAVPIVGRQGSLGAIRALRRKTGNPYLDNSFTSDDQRLLQTIAEQISAGIENVRNIARIVQAERMAAWGELSAKSSHMIGNRVFALKGDVNELKHLLEESTPNLEQLKAIQASIQTNVGRVDELLQDFRDFVTATNLVKLETDLNDLVKETAEELFPKRGEVRLELELGSLPPVAVDAKKLRRAIGELIENSLSHLEGGKIRISTQEVPGDNSMGRAQKYASIEIEDSGPGVPTEFKSLIFQPFFSSRIRGMGLGLSIVKGIVDAHGGEVFEAGQDGEGAKFVILLPIDQAARN